MTKGKKVGLGLLVVFAVATAVVLYQAPEIARWHVKSDYSEIDPRGKIKINWYALVTNATFTETITFDDVKITRPGIEAVIRRVGVFRDLSIALSGGTIDIDVEKLPKKGTGVSSKRVTTGGGLTVNVTKGDAKATLTDTTFGRGPDGKLGGCFKKAEVYYKHDFTLHDGCFDKTKADIERVEMVVKLPFDVPRMERTQQLTVEDVTLTVVDRLIQFDKATLGAFEVVGPAFVTIGGKDHSTHFTAAGIKANHPWIAPHPVTFDDVSMIVPTSLLRGEDLMLAVVRVRLGKAAVRIDPINWLIEGDEPCSEWLDAMPKPLPESMRGMAGNFTGSLRFEVRAKPTPHLEIKHDCKYKCSAAPIKPILARSFTYQVYDKDNNLVDRTAGPGVAGWVSLAGLPPFVPEAFRLSEDPGFHFHKGLHVMALKNSLVANLASGSFVKGGSTISMQLAKNLWLRRHKTIGRKANEALLTLALESCLSKPRIMEMYMNVVEYAPDVYGLGPAVKHYFRGTNPYDLQPDEAYYLAKLLPNPKKALPPNGGGLEQARRHMTKLANSGFISDHLLVSVDDEALKDTDTTGWDIVD